jgi:TonB family protein
VNIASVANKDGIQLVANLMIFAGLFVYAQSVWAQSASVNQSAQSDSGIITISARGTVSSNLGRNENELLGIVAPEYPVRARQRRVDGWVLVSFSVNEDGKVDAESIVVVDSEPSGIFERASIRSASQFEFRPRIVDGTAVGVNGLQYVFSYLMDERVSVALPRDARNRDYLPLNYITPRYPSVAMEENVEGYVLVEFTVTKEGLPRGVVILDRSPSSIFNASAVNAAERFRFDPRIVDGNPAEAEGAQYLFTFEPDN